MGNTPNKGLSGGALSEKGSVFRLPAFYKGKDGIQ